MLTQDFYGEDYAVSLEAFVGAAADDLADAIVRTFPPTRVLDVGCGLGQVVWALRTRGVDATGCDYSETFLANAPAEVRPHLRQADVTDLSAFETDGYDLVLCMEVVEHLPERLARRCVRELRRLSRGTVVITTPSFGRNGGGRFGLPPDTPTWRRDALAGRRFSKIVLDEEGRPHVGHLTLATYDWWTALFQDEGLVRNRDVENAWLEDPERPLWHHRWNPYVLHEARSASFVVGENCVAQAGEGWLPAEEWGPGEQARWTTASARLHLRADADGPALTLLVSAGPEALVWPRELVVTTRTRAGERAARLLLEPGRWTHVRLRGCGARAGEVFEVELATPRTFRPSLLPDGARDDRDLGVAVRSVVASRERWRPGGVRLRRLPAPTRV